MGISRRALAASSGRAAVRGMASGSPYTSERPVAAELAHVRAPYCALQDVSVHELGHVSARVWAEQALEHGAISAAEAVRHMSIAGSMACATYAADPQRRHYYLAERAWLRSDAQSSASALGSRGPLRVEARHVHSNAHEAVADCQLHGSEGQPLFGLRVLYKRVQAAVFERVFSEFRVEMRRSARRSEDALSDVTLRRLRQNPYQRRLDVRICELEAQCVRGELPIVAAEACAGHFAQYPALPLSALVEAFSLLGGALLRKRFAAADLGYRVHDADITASKLLFAGQTLSLHGCVLEDVAAERSRVRLHARAGNGEEVASMTALLEGVASGNQ